MPSIKFCEIAKVLILRFSNYSNIQLFEFAAFQTFQLFSDIRRFLIKPDI